MVLLFLCLASSILHCSYIHQNHNLDQTDKCFTTMKAGGEGWDPVKLDYPAHPRWLITDRSFCGTFLWIVMYCFTF